MPKLEARLSDYERDSLLLAMAAMLTGVMDRQLPLGISIPAAHLGRKYVDALAAEVKSREENR